MASGKQVSFSLGEVSPALQFRADANFYSIALRKLLNCFVRKSGGVSNRPGTKFYFEPGNQDNILATTKDIGVRLFPFKSTTGVSFIFELRKYVDDSTNASISQNSPLRVLSDVNGTLLMADMPFVNGLTLFSSPSDPEILDLNSATITQLNDSAVITVNSNRGCRIFVIALSISAEQAAFIIASQNIAAAQRGYDDAIYVGQDPTLIASTLANLDAAKIAYDDALDSSGNINSDIAVAARNSLIIAQTAYNSAIIAGDPATIKTAHDALEAAKAAGAIAYDRYINSPPLFTVDIQLPVPKAVGQPADITTLDWFGLDPKDIPVCYMVTQEMDDGSEVLWQQFCAVGGHPHSQLSSHFLVDAQIQYGVRQYNIYRSDGSKASMAGAVPTVTLIGAHFALVGRIGPSGTGTVFNDFLTAPDLTVQPPTDSFLYPTAFEVKKLAYYKQRTVIVYANIPFGRYIHGQVGVSKIGAPKMFGRPLTPNNIDAFSFTIPIEKLSPITHILSMNRLIVFTEHYTFSIRGGISGLLTPQEVNPETIYNEGCSQDVEPVATGNRGYFVNKDKSKLLVIAFQRDDAVEVADISIYSDHLFEAKDVRTLAISNNAESVLWVLKKDGKLLSVTVSDDGSVLGYANHETDGYIEDIAIQDTPVAVYAKDTETQTSTTLLLSVIRDGVRYYEKMVVRDDINDTRFIYADAAVTFGGAKTGLPLNIKAITDYSGGSTFELQYNGLLAPPFSASWVGAVIDFYFTRTVDGQDPLQTKIRIYVDDYTAPYTALCHCEEDIPPELQDIDSQSLTEDEKTALKSNWAECTNIVVDLFHLKNKDVSVFADGVVISSPNNPDIDPLTVDEFGTLTLPDYYAWGYVGLPYTSEMETLNLEAQDSRTFTDVGKLINKVGVGLKRTANLFVGQTGASDVQSMEQYKTRQQLSIEEISGLYSGYLHVNFPANWEQTGRVLFRQVDPLPMSILAVYPKGTIGD